MVKHGEFRLFAPDFPDWIEDNGAGIKLAPDTRTTSIMKKVLNELESNRPLYKLFEELHNNGAPVTSISPLDGSTNLTRIINPSLHFFNQQLNYSQQQAVDAIKQNEPITIVHGPPGTGKTPR
jgi:hypothetical protein